MTAPTLRFVIPEDLERVPTRWPLGGFRLTSREICWLVVLGALELGLLTVLVPLVGIGPLAGFALAVPVLMGWSLMRLRVNDVPLDGYLLAMARYWTGPRLLGRQRQPLRRAWRASLPDPLYRLNLETPQPARVARHGWGFRVSR